MFFNSRSIFTLVSLCVLIMMSIPSSYINTASYAQGNTTSKLIPSSPSRSTLASDNSTLGAVSNNQELLQAKLVAKDVEDTLRDGVSALELVANNLTPMMIPPNQTLLKSNLKTLHGIPQNGDEPKRKLAQDIISKYKIFGYIGYDTPRGDINFAEPYSPAQTHLQTLNFAFREHFKGFIASKGPFLSNVINSFSYGTPHAAIAIPVYSQNSSRPLIGVLVGGLNFTYFDQSIRTLNLTDHNHRIILADHNGTAIFDSLLHNNYARKLGYVASLQSFKNALEGKSGSIVEPFDGTKMLISYHPVKAVQRSWIILLMKTI
jgi:Cache domain